MDDNKLIEQFHAVIQQLRAGGSQLLADEFTRVLIKELMTKGLIDFSRENGPSQASSLMNRD